MPRQTWLNHVLSSFGDGSIIAESTKHHFLKCHNVIISAPHRGNILNHSQKIVAVPSGIVVRAIFNYRKTGLGNLKWEKSALGGKGEIRGGKNETNGWIGQQGYLSDSYWHVFIFYVNRVGNNLLLVIQ